jgi:hypothetical protein
MLAVPGLQRSQRAALSPARWPRIWLITPAFVTMATHCAACRETRRLNGEPTRHSLTKHFSWPGGESLQRIDISAVRKLGCDESGFDGSARVLGCRTG